jgi:hypothetical protein
MVKTHASAAFEVAMIITACLAAGSFPGLLRAQPEKPAVFRVKNISDTTLYIDAGHNAGLQVRLRRPTAETPAAI